MPPHTISPTPSSQGLGIFTSTLSPPSADMSPSTSSSGGGGAYQPTLTGMGVHNRPTYSNPSPLRHNLPLAAPLPAQYGVTNTRGQPLYQPGPAPSPPRARYAPPGQVAARQQQQLYQPNFSLRPTHQRHQSAQGFASFSAIPPSPSRPMGPRARASGHATSSSVSSSSPLTQAEEQESEAGHVPERPLSTEEKGKWKAPAPSRTPSTTSTATSNSANRHIRPSKSSELLRRLSKAGEKQEATISGGRYVPLSGQEDQPLQPESTSPLSRKCSTATNATEKPAGGRSRSTTMSTLPIPFPVPSTPKAMSTSATQNSFGSLPTSFPDPPHRIPSQSYHPQHHRSNSAASSHFTASPQADSQHRRTNSSSSLLPRSMSSPVNLQSVPEERRNSAYPPTHNSRPSLDGTKRLSDLSTGTHSKNAVLFSAETGGMMLAFSPNGDGIWKAGEAIDGLRSSLLPTPLPVNLSNGHPPYPPTRHMTAPPMAHSRSAGGIDQQDDDLRSRPWSESTMSQHMKTTGHRARSLSDGAAMLARQGTLFHPASDNQRASLELNVMLGKRSRKASKDKLLAPPELQGWQDSGGPVDHVRVEAAKKRKARVEVDVVLERECVVEGGEVRGRMEIRVNGGKRSEGLRIGGGKVRVVGFEDLGSSRHIFYHHPHSLPLFAHPSAEPARHSLFDSEPNEEGYRLAAEGTHSIPFRMRLPLGGGAKGSYGTQGNGPSVRYVVVGSVKLHLTSTGKRSIAHFYRPIVVLPYLNPTVVLAPSPEPVEAIIEKGLGWSLTGEKGRVELSVALGRRIWVSGQRVWCEVGIKNDSNRKVKSLNLALLQTVQCFRPDERLDTEPRLFKSARKSEPDVDACQTSTQRRKVSEEIIEADFGDHGAGHVTGKGWWTGVEPGEKGQWDLSLHIPSGMVSIRRTRLLEVMYTLRVTVNNSIYVDVPITLINFLSIDPPPMPGDGIRLTPKQSVAQIVPQPTKVPLGVELGDSSFRPTDHRRLISNGGNSMMSNPAARASSTTLHIDSLLAAGRERAAAQGEPGVAVPRSRPISMGSTYTLDKPSMESLKSGAPVRPKGSRLMSYLSDRSSAPEEREEEDHREEDEDEEDETDKALLAARRRTARQLSLAAIHRAIDREQEDIARFDEAEAVAAAKAAEEGMSPAPEGEFRPFGTPSEEQYEMGGTPRASSVHTGDQRTISSRRTLQKVEEGSLSPVSIRSRLSTECEKINSPSLSARARELDTIPDQAEVEGDSHDVEHESELARPPAVREIDIGTPGESHYEQEQHHEDADGAEGDETFLEDLPDIPEEGDGIPGNETLLEHLISPPSEPSVSLPPPSPQMFDYSEEIEGGTSPRLGVPSLGYSSRDEHIGATRSIYGSFANSAISGNSGDAESELGTVTEAVKRNFSIRLPPRVMPAAQALPNKNNRLMVPRAGSLPVSHQSTGRRPSMSSGAFASPERRSSNEGYPYPSSNSSRRGSIPQLQPGYTMRRESSSTPTASSPLRPVDTALANTAYDKRRPSLGVPTSPMRSTAPLRLSPRKGSPGLSPRSTHPTAMINPGEPMLRQASHASASSHLRHEVPIPLRSNTDSTMSSADDHPPELAPSVASDSASSDENALDSPSIASPPAHIIGASPKLTKDDVTLKIDIPRPEFRDSWTVGHLTTQEVFLAHTEARAMRAGGMASPPVSSPRSETSEESMLPGMRTKIAQLESRDEALRKFSVASAVSKHSTGSIGRSGPGPQIQLPPLPHAYAHGPPNSATTSPARASPQSKRRSYTAALAPRTSGALADVQAYGTPRSPTRVASPTSPQSQGSISSLGHTTYVGKKRPSNGYSSPWDARESGTFGSFTRAVQAEHVQQPHHSGGRATLEVQGWGGRKDSTSSMVSNAERALMDRREGSGRWGRRESGVGHVQEETDDSEGLL